MKILNLIKRTLISLHLSLKRFPVTLSLTASVAVMLIIISEYSKFGDRITRDMLSRIAMVLALGIPVSLCIKFLFERQDKVKNTAKVVLYFTAAAFLIIYYFFFLKNFNMVPVTRYAAVSIAFYLTALYIPYFYDKNNFELYTIKLLIRFFITILFSLVLQAGISAILFTIDKLLGIHVYDRLYYYVWLCIAGIFAPSYFLAGIPGRNDELYISEYPKVLKVLLLYIVMPIISVYTLILYIYFAKIVITLQWPQGLVGNLVLWYSIISTIVIFLIWPLIHENRWVKGFIFWFIKLVLPLIAIMFISLGIRIKAYGITENRYFVIIVGLWVLGIMLYWNISKQKRNIILLISLSVVAFLSVTGPWSAYSISISSQNKRFESILIKNNMIKNNKIVKPADNISDNDKREIGEIIRYFNTSHSLKDLKYLPDSFKLDDMKNVFGFDYQDYRFKPGQDMYFSYMLNDIKTPIDISGYDYLFNFRYPGNLQSQSSQRLKAQYSCENHEIRVYLDGSEVYKNNLESFVEKVHGRYAAASNPNLSVNDMTFTDENSRIKIKFILFSINGSKEPDSDKIKVQSIDFDMLIKIK